MGDVSDSLSRKVLPQLDQGAETDGVHRAKVGKYDSCRVCREVHRVGSLCTPHSG